MQESVNIGEQKDYKDILKKENIIMLLSCLGLGIAFDILFYGKAIGISYPLFVIMFYSVLLLNLKGKYSYRLNFGWSLTIPIFLLSLTYFFYSNDIFRTLNFIGIPVLIVAQTILITKSNRNCWYSPSFIKDIFYIAVYRLLNNIPKPFILVSGLLKEKTNPKKYDTVKKIIIGLVISLPLLFVIVPLLSSADQVFNHFIGEIPRFLDDLSLGELTARLLMILILTVLLFSFLWALASDDDVKSGVNNEIDKEKKGFLDPVIICTILISINLIYILFTVIQFSYLFGSIKSALPQNFSYSEYARRGFFELIVVTLINFSILLGNINFLKRGGKRLHRFLQILNSLLVICTMVMLFSAHFRMSLYEEKYGYTYLRMLTHAFMVFLFILFIIALYKIWKEGMALLRPYIVVALIAYVIMNYINIDVIIARNNMNRYEKMNTIDVQYMSYLSYDAVKEMLPLLESKDKAVAARAENILFQKKEKLAGNNRWQSFNLSEYRAETILKRYNLHHEEQGDEYNYTRDY